MSVAADIVRFIRLQEPAGRFLKNDPEDGAWYDIGGLKAIENVGRMLYETHKYKQEVELSLFEMLIGNRTNDEFGYHTSSYQMVPPNMPNGQQIAHQLEPHQHGQQSIHPSSLQEQHQHQLEETARPHKKRRRFGRGASSSCLPSLSPSIAAAVDVRPPWPRRPHKLFHKDDNRVDKKMEVIVEIDI